jgi:serine/threonine protein kinase
VVWVADFGCESLGSYLRRLRSKEVAKPWTATERLSVLCGAVLGLKSLHERGLFSGSLKPSSILLDSEFNVRLTDYVSVSLAKYQLTSHRPMASPDHISVISPESDEGTFDFSNATSVSDYQKVDIFCLGVAMYEILTDREVFRSNLSTADLTRQIRGGTRPSIPTVWGAFGEILGQCWNANPSKRPSIDDVWEAVWFMGYQIIGDVDRQLLRSRFDGWAPPPITLETLDKLKKGHYIECGELGSGRHGTVRRLQVRLGQEIGDFAAKTYQQEESQEEDIEHFALLLEAFGSLRHPCLARIVFAEPPTTEMGPVVWTDYFESHWGSSLGRYLKDVRAGASVRRMSPTEQVLVICGMVLGLVALHKSNLFHGNLKPFDILLESNAESDLNVHLTDSISYSLEHSYLTYSCLVSSPNYSAPECYELEDADFGLVKPKSYSALQRVDVFSCGLIVYAILTGHEVFSPELSAADLRRKTQSRERPSIPTSIRPGFQQLIDRCWESDPSKRPSIGEVWHVLVEMTFGIIDGVDSNYVGTQVSRWSQP